MLGFFFGLVKCVNWWMFSFLEEEERWVITDIYEVCVILKLLVTTITLLLLYPYAIKLPTNAQQPPRLRQTDPWSRTKRRRRSVESTVMTLLLLSNALNIDNTRNRVLSSIYSSVVSRSSSEPMRLFQSMETIVPAVRTTQYSTTQTKAFDEGVDTLRKSILLVLSSVVHLWKAPRELCAVSGEFWMLDRGHYSSMATTANVFSSAT